MQTEKAQIFLICLFWVYVIGVAAKLLIVANLEYPRVVKWKRGEDVFDLCVKIIIATSIAYILGWVRF